MRIEGRSVLVAGGASGLGAATARRLHAAGARVVIADRNVEAGSELAGQLGERAQFVRADVTVPEDVSEAVAVAASASGGLRASVCCAGIGWAERVARSKGPHGLDPFERVLSVNVTGTFNVLRQAAHAMLANPPSDGGERGVCVNT